MTKRFLGLTVALGTLVVLLVLYAFFKLPLPASGPIQAIFFGTESPEEIEEVIRDPITFRIEQEESEVRYIIREVQGMMPNTVIGVTDQVAGEFTINPSEPDELEVSTIMINARTFQTDEELRDRAVQNRILYTDTYEYITFEPDEYDGLPEHGLVGESYDFQMTGKLTLLDETNEVTWDVTVEVISAERLEGTAQTTVRYGEWGVSVPEMPFIASVDDTVRLELDFVAAAVEEEDE